MDGHVPRWHQERSRRRSVSLTPAKFRAVRCLHNSGPTCLLAQRTATMEEFSTTGTRPNSRGSTRGCSATFLSVLHDSSANHGR